MTEYNSTDKIHSWAPDQYVSKARLQAEQTSRASGVDGVALMPDAHFGSGACIGSVVATDGTILPSAVGVDLGCGMTAVKLDCTLDDLPDNQKIILNAFGDSVPQTVHSDNKRVSSARRDALKWMRNNPVPSGMGNMGTAAAQMGTLGSGNHFLELSADEEFAVWIVIHSGSRGIGNWLARQHIKVAKAMDKAAEVKDLAALVEGTPEFDAYIADMLWAQEYALQNRDAALFSAIEAFRTVTGLTAAILDIVRCHHNYAQKEIHDGRRLWITRKGAIRAQVGDRGIIPGSMGTSTYIVEGLGNQRAYNSAAHGAGRTMSRREAKETLSREEFKRQMAGRVWQEDSLGALLDEAPGAYKDIHEVMRLQKTLCTPVSCLDALVNFKGTK